VFLNFYLTDLQDIEGPAVGVIELRRGYKLFGYGWLVFKDNENVYVMTSNSVLRLIKSHQVDNALEIRVFSVIDEPANYDATVTNATSFPGPFLKMRQGKRPWHRLVFYAF
jgi:hypothetical protein